MLPPFLNRILTHGRLAFPLACLLAWLPAYSAWDLTTFLAQEQKTNHAELRRLDSLAPYFLSYRVNDTTALHFSLNKGGFIADRKQSGRALQVEARVGSREIDNSHPMREALDFAQWRGFQNVALPLDSNAEYLRRALRTSTDFASRAARDQYLKIVQNLRVRPATEDSGMDFSISPKVVVREKNKPAIPERKALGLFADSLREISKLFISPAWLYSSSISVDFRQVEKRLVTTEGTQLHQVEKLGTVSLYVETKATDGMVLWLAQDWSWRDLKDLPAPPEIREKTLALLARLDSLRQAPVMETYSGPVLLRNKAAAVFVHEVFGHRVEGHRQRAVDEGQTFVQKMGHALTLPTIRIEDDPTLAVWDKVVLNGFYVYDDEGVKSRRTPLLWNGIFKDFLLSRSVVSPRGHSNGHGRAMLSLPVVARMGNTRLSCTEPIAAANLRDTLKAWLRRTGNPFGLMVHELSGGYTYTGRDLPQTFKLEPLFVTQIFADATPDRLVRGVDVVGTPLQSLAQIVAAADDPAVFNGYCGAESGWLPVSAISPSLILSSLEFESRSKDQNRPPILPPPGSRP
jgi:TldD protein